MTKRKGTPKETRPSTCVGCGGAAAGYNYEAPSCYSCKTFFRRTVVEGKLHLACVKNGFCAREGATSQCRACRFLKCVRGGMNPRMITNIDNLNENKVVQRFYGSTDAEQSTPSTGSCTREAPDRQKRLLPIVSQPARIEAKLERLMLNLLVLEEAHHKLRISTYSPKLVAGLSMEDFSGGPSKLGIHYEQMFPQAYEPVSIQLFPEEAIIKYRVSMDLTDFDFTTRKLWVFQDVVYAMEFIKALPVFRQLDDCSKQVLLASSLSCSNFTTAFFSYSKNSDRSCYPDGGTMSWNKEMQEQSPDSTRFHTALIAAMRDIRLDKREYTLLKMIIVCNPMLNGLSQHGVALLQQEKELCTKTLFSYVLAQRGVREGPALLARLLSIIDLEMRLTSWMKSQHILIMAMGLYKYPMPLTDTIFHSY